MIKHPILNKYIIINRTWFRALAYRVVSNWDLILNIRILELSCFCNEKISKQPTISCQISEWLPGAKGASIIANMKYSMDWEGAVYEILVATAVCGKLLKSLLPDIKPHPYPWFFTLLSPRAEWWFQLQALLTMALLQLSVFIGNGSSDSNWHPGFCLWQSGSSLLLA